MVANPAINLESGTPLAASNEAALFQRIQQLLHASSAERDLVGRTDHVTLLPNRVRFLADFAACRDQPNAQSIVLVTLADARHFNDLLRALGHSYSEDFVRAGVARLSGLLPTETQIYHVSVLSLAFFVDSGPDGRPPAVVFDIAAAFRQSIVCQDIPVDTKVGIGVTPLDGKGSDASELLRATLAAAQDSRRTHEGWAWYDASTDEAHRRAFRILTDLPAAFTACDQLRLDYQPRIAMQDGACVSAEALIRWTHPELGIVSPAEFVPLAEATALITPLTQWVLERAMQTAASWQKLRPGLKISVNISPKNLEEPDFVTLLRDVVARHHVDPAVVELEFTEGMLAANWKFMMQQMQRLRGDGFEIAIDDFGSGYSNMSYLGKIPAKYLKIDQAFVRPLDHEHKNQVLVRAIIEMAHALEYAVVAEGVETRHAYELLSGWGCDEGQGYFMSRPLALGPFREWIEAQPS